MSVMSGGHWSWGLMARSMTPWTINWSSQVLNFHLDRHLPQKMRIKVLRLEVPGKSEKSSRWFFGLGHWVFGPIPGAFSRQRCEDLANFTMESMEPWKKKQPCAEDGWSFPNDDVCTCLKVLELIIVDVDVLSVPAPCHFLQYHDLSKLEDSAF